MRSASGRFGLNLGRSNKEQAIDKDGDSSIQNGHNRAVSGNSGTGGVGLGGAGDIAKSVKGRIAHTTIVRTRRVATSVTFQLANLEANR
jgi:hypothetical protein